MEQAQAWECRPGAWGRSDHHGLLVTPLAFLSLRLGLVPPQLLPQRLLPVGEIQLLFLQSVLKQEGSGSYGEFSLKTLDFGTIFFILSLVGGHTV